VKLADRAEAFANLFTQSMMHTKTKMNFAIG